MSAQRKSLPFNSKEIQLLLHCARTQINEQTAEQIRELVSEELDWFALLQKAFHHRVMPLICLGLTTACPDEVPDPIKSQLRDFLRINALHNLYLAEELINLLNFLGAHDITAVPFKGPILAMKVYKNLAHRQFSDVDILVKKKDFKKTKELLASIQYQSSAEFEWEHHFVHSQKRVIVDLHQRFIIFEFDSIFDYQKLWANLESTTILCSTITIFSMEDRFIILVVQFIKDYCNNHSKLAQLCDLSELITSYPDTNWQRVWQHFRQRKCEKLLVFTLSTVRELPGISLPPSLSVKMPDDERITLLARTAITELCEEFQNKPKTFTKTMLMLMGKENVLERMPYILRRHLTPAKDDKQVVSLPYTFSWVYYLIRPIRILSKYSFIRLTKRLP